VTLDRVLNVYPDWQRLTELSAQHAQRLYGLVYPRNTLMVRLVTFAMNVLLRLLRKPVRASVRPGEAIDLVARERGLVRHFSQSVGPAWQVAVYRRPDRRCPRWRLERVRTPGPGLPRRSRLPVRPWWNGVPRR
jgi:hypothetical protein